MAKKMLIDDTQKEETRVVIVDGNKVEDVEFESTSRKQIKGNIYTAKVIRIEPSLQAAFIDYGGNRYGFLAFNEIHPDYYNVSDEVMKEVDAEVDEGSELRRSDNNVFWKTDFAEKFTTSNDGLDALLSTFSKEAPKGSTAEKINWIVWNIVTDTEKFRENDVENCKHHQWTKECPQITKDGALITEFEIRFGEFLKKNPIFAIQNTRNFHIYRYFIIFYCLARRFERM
jgi:Ribonuclease G/E